MAKCEVIVEVLAEGGSITLYGIRNGPGWIFARSVNDFTPELVDEDTILHKSARVESWGAALGLLDKYRWYSFYPAKVHPDFRKQVWIALQERICSDSRSRIEIDRWRDLCTC